MKTSTKVTIGVTFLFLLIMAMGITSIYYIRSLASDTGRLIKDNQHSIDYVEHMNQDIVHLQGFAIYGSARIDLRSNEIENTFSDFNKNLDSESHNITEPGEAESVTHLTSDLGHYQTAFNKMINGYSGDSVYQIMSPYMKLQYDLSTIYELNKKAILKKNTAESKTASNAVFYITLIGSVFIVVAFAFLFVFRVDNLPNSNPASL